ncbi:MAG: rod shape-determining protein MreD [Candidatus Aquicultorales bacterium]
MRQPFASMAMLILALLLQASIVPRVAIAGVQPDVVLIVVVLIGFSEGSVNGGLFGFGGGLLQDLLLGGQVVGLSAFSKSVVGFISGLVERTIFVENVLLPMGAILVASVVNEFTYAGFNFILGEQVGLSKLFFDIALPTAVYNALVMPLIYVLYHRLTAPRIDRAPVIRRSWK